jgi:hypothetical protein
MPFRVHKSSCIATSSADFFGAFGKIQTEKIARVKCLVCNKTEMIFNFFRLASHLENTMFTEGNRG